MDCNFPFLIRRYSTLRNDLPFLVWQRYFTKASPAPVVIRSRSKCPMKSTCVSQHCVLKVPLLMWSSPAALVKVKLSASSILNVPRSFFSHAAYHSRMISSFVESCRPKAPALVSPGRSTAPASANAPVASRFLRGIVILVIVRSPFMMEFETLGRTAMPSASLVVVRMPKRLQPSHDISDSRFPHLRILSILC